MLAAQAASKLVEVCEQGPGSMKMPRTIQLVKQLKKELNLPKLVKDQHKRKKIASKWWCVMQTSGQDGEGSEVKVEGAELKSQLDLILHPRSIKLAQPL